MTDGKPTNSEKDSFDPTAVVENRESTGTGSNIGLYAIATVVGLISGLLFGTTIFLIAADLFRPAIATRSPLDQYAPLMGGLSVFIGGIIGLHIQRENGLRKVLYLASYPFIWIIGIFVMEMMITVPLDFPSKSLHPQFTAVIALIAALLAGEIWHQVYRRLVS